MQKDFIIVLAWPEGMTASVNKWYDKFFATNGKYRVGHSALVFVDAQKKDIYYYDFGRYHTPLGFGRARNKKTDHDVRVKTKATIKNGEIINIQEILFELKVKKSLHGDGTLYASILNNISIIKGMKYANRVVNNGLIPYGPVVLNGTNCSRFVASVMRASCPEYLINRRLKFPITLSPSPKRNVGIANSNFYKVTNSSCSFIKRSWISSYLRSIER